MGFDDAPLVLLIDFDEGVRQMLSRFLRSNGYVVAEAGSVAQALTLTAQCMPNLVLCDLHMSDTDIACCQDLRANCLFIPIIAMSAGGYPGDVFGLHFDQWISKPFDLHFLRHLINTCLGFQHPAGF